MNNEIDINECKEILMRNLAYTVLFLELILCT